MPLLDLKTDLKSIKYGQDRADGGSSGQPYIQTDINTVDRGINKLRFGNFDEGLVRGGVVGMLNSSITDTLRIGKFLTDTPKGPLFIVKQIGLQLSNPRLESKQVAVDRSTRGGGFITNAINFISNVAGKIENIVGPTRIYNLGINTLAQVPINGIGGHIVRHGFLPVADPSKYYEAVVTHNNKNGTNRLERLKTLLIGTSNTEISRYIGGPDSVYGIGSTLIRRATTPEGASFDTSDNAGLPLVNGKRQAFTYIDPETFNGAISSGLGQRNSASGYNKTNRIGGIAYNTSTVNKFGAFSETETDPNKLSEGIDQSVNTDGYKVSKTNPHIIPVDLYNTLGVSKQYFSGSNQSEDIGINPGSKSKTWDNGFNITDTAQRNSTSINTDNVTIVALPPNYSRYKKIIEGKQLRGKGLIEKGINEFGLYDNTKGGGLSQNPPEILPTSPSYPTYKNYYGDKITFKKPWNTITRELRVGSGRQDQINLTPILDNIDKYDGSDTQGTHNIRDLVKFRIQAVNTDINPSLGSLMVFRAYLTAMSDSVDATWSPIKYAGRGDQFYIYDGFSRKMSVSFKVAALSAEEMKPMYQKLNFLMGNLMPDYENNLMRGPLVRMTIGNYIDAQLCKLDSVSYTIPQDSPWEIAMDEPEGGEKYLILPHVIEVQLSFTPIGSESKAHNELQSKSQTISHIAQNNTGDIVTQYINSPKSKADRLDGIKKEVNIPPTTIRTTGIPFVSARNAISTRNPFAPF